MKVRVAIGLLITWGAAAMGFQQFACGFGLGWGAYIILSDLELAGKL